MYTLPVSYTHLDVYKRQILDGKVCSNVVQDEETKKKNRDALFADLEGNLDIGGEAAKEQKK